MLVGGPFTLTIAIASMYTASDLPFQPKLARAMRRIPSYWAITGNNNGSGANARVYHLLVGTFCPSPDGRTEKLDRLVNHAIAKMNQKIQLIGGSATNSCSTHAGSIVSSGQSLCHLDAFS